MKKSKTKIMSVFAVAAILTAVLVMLPILATECLSNSEEQGRDFTAELLVEYTVPTGAMIVEDRTYTCIEYAYSRDIVKIAANSDVIVRGTVEKVANTSLANVDSKTEHRFPYAAINFKISECFKGDLKKDDKITIFQTGSYMPLRDYINYYGDSSEREIKEILLSMNDDEIDNAFYHINPIDEAPADVGEECIYFLKYEGNDSSLNGSYRLTRGAASVLHCKLDGTLTRYPSDSALDQANENIEYETFTLDSVITAISKSEDYVPREKY